jgi:hypothetical protein
MESDAEQATLRCVVDRQVEDDALDVAVHDAFDLAGVLLGDEEVVRAEKGHRARCRETADSGSHLQVRIEHLRPALRGDGRADDPDGEDEPREQDPCWTTSSLLQETHLPIVVLLVRRRSGGGPRATGATRCSPCGMTPKEVLRGAVRDGFLRR